MRTLVLSIAALAAAAAGANAQPTRLTEAQLDQVSAGQLIWIASESNPGLFSMLNGQSISGIDAGTSTLAAVNGSGGGGGNNNGNGNVGNNNGNGNVGNNNGNSNAGSGNGNANIESSRGNGVAGNGVGNGNLAAPAPSVLAAQPLALGSPTALQAGQLVFVPGLGQLILAPGGAWLVR